MPISLPAMQFHDVNGFLTALRGGPQESNSALPAPPQHGTVGGALAPGSTPLRNHRSLNGFGAPFPSFSGAVSSDRLSAGGGGPHSRPFSALRSTGEPSLGSFNNGLHPMPSLSSDPPLHSSTIPQRSPASPIPLLHPNAFANNNSSYHHFPFSNLNQSPSSVARNALNYSPQPPPPSSATVTASHPHPTSIPPRSGISPHTQPPPPQQPQPSHHQVVSHPPPHAHQQSSRQPSPVEQSQEASNTHARPQERSQTQMQQPFSQYAAPQPQPVYKVPIVDPNPVARQPASLPPTSRPLRPPERPANTTAAPPVTETLPEPKRGRSSQTPSKRARTNGRQSPATPRSATAAASGVSGWGSQTGGSYKSRSGTTVPSNTDGTANGHTTSGAEEQSRPERKREREKRRRETMNTRFSELAKCLVISAGGKSDKESILAEAVEHCKKQAATIRDLERKNQELMSAGRELQAEKSDLRRDKNDLREESDRLKAELEALRAELDGRKRQKIEYETKREDVKRQPVKRNGENSGSRKAEAVIV